MHKIVAHPTTFARFTSSPSISCTPLTLFVQSNTSVNAASYAWYINNVFYSDSKIPNDTILIKSGIRYNLKLVASSPYGCLSDSLISVITTYTAPISKFNISQASSCSGALQVSFYNTSIASGTNINTWFWDFGDGTTSMIPNPVHQYNLPGSYNVSLNVQDGRGCFSDSATVKKIIIYGKPTANYLADNVCLGDSVRFTNLSQLGFGSSQFDKVFWNFGDGTNSSVFSPSHLYSGAGTYTITLTVLSDKSCVVDTIIKKVTVFGKPKADFSWDISCVNMPINFTDLSVPGFGEVALSNTKWDFGNGITSNLFSPRIQYSSTGIYQISLKVYNAICSNLADTIYKQISIYEARQGVRYPRIEAVYGNPEPLHALVGGISYNWSPATGLDYSNIKDPIAIYDNRVANKIDYSILIKDSAGCIINDYQEVYIFLKPAILAPTAFIVDGSDPLNRRFLPHYININRLMNFRILDRWGVEQFSTADMSKYWDGNDKKGNPLPLETYIWIAVGIDNDGNQVIGKGNITLVRNGNK
jgi:PKD repeat protein